MYEDVIYRPATTDRAWYTGDYTGHWFLELKAPVCGLQSTFTDICAVYLAGGVSATSVSCLLCGHHSRGRA